VKLKIFVIDDEESVRDSFKWYLEDLGHEVVAASAPASCQVYNGHTCRQSMACGDALLIDYNMPGMTGLEFIERLKSQGCKGITANMLIMSGNISGVDIQKAGEYGCIVLQKPVSFERLSAWLDEVKKRVATKKAATCAGSANAA
jgi:two-component system response regulator FixJ